jgi:hypothetical protein
MATRQGANGKWLAESGKVSGLIHLRTIESRKQLNYNTMTL